MERHVFFLRVLRSFIGCPFCGGEYYSSFTASEQAKLIHSTHIDHMKVHLAIAECVGLHKRTVLHRA